MKSFDDDKVARLLRLKRYELPPPGYFENFLHDFRRRRQEDQLLRGSLWSICVEYARAFVLRHNVRPAAFYSAGVAIAVGCAAVILITLYPQPDTTQVAVQNSPVPTTPSITEEELDFAPAEFIPTFDMQPTLLPAGRNVRALSPDRFRSDQAIQLQLEWESVQDLKLPDR
jgi:hypothetical protein